MEAFEQRIELNFLFDIDWTSLAHLPKIPTSGPEAGAPKNSPLYSLQQQVWYLDQKQFYEAIHTYYTFAKCRHPYQTGTVKYSL